MARVNLYIWKIHEDFWNSIPRGKKNKYINYLIAKDLEARKKVAESAGS